MKRFDFRCVTKRASTYCGALAAFAGGALGAYALAPTRAQDLVPDWALLALIGLAILGGGGVALATSFKQKNLAPASTGTPPAP
ncbi:MAG: hypothetical protein ACREO4_16405 [Lysobacter sp.]